MIFFPKIYEACGQNFRQIEQSDHSEPEFCYRFSCMPIAREQQKIRPSKQWHQLIYQVSATWMGRIWRREQYHVISAGKLLIPSFDRPTWWSFFFPKAEKSNVCTSSWGSNDISFLLFVHNILYRRTNAILWELYWEGLPQYQAAEKLSQQCDS